MSERLQQIEVLPIHQNLERFAPDYFPEQFTDEESQLIEPFFSNLDKPVYVIQHLPEEVSAALCSRYSRATASMRRTFLNEYVMPMVHPELQKSWEAMSDEDQQAAFETRDGFLIYVQSLRETGGVDEVINRQRARKFFNKWLSDYGDDSIAELGGVHIAIEGISNLVLEDIVDKRVGQSLIVKSSRYVSYSDRNPDGSYKFVVPGELKGSEYEEEYRRVMNLLFDAYAQLEQPYLDYIKGLYPKGEDETDSSFNRSRGAKRYDDIRDLLPFATQNNLGLFANGRSMEDLISKLALHPSGECRWLGQSLYTELQKVIPSLVNRAGTPRGAEAQTYRQDIRDLQSDMYNELSKQMLDTLVEQADKQETIAPHGPAVRLLSVTPDSDVSVLTSFIFPGGSGIEYKEIYDRVQQMSPEERKQRIAKILEKRTLGESDAKREVARFRKVPRAFEVVHFVHEWWGRGGDYRDLHRHRQMTESHQPFTTQWGYDLEQEVLNSPFALQIHTAIHEAGVLAAKIAEEDPQLAQYVIPYAYLQHWFTDMSARSIYWQAELRSGPQGRPHYRWLVQQATLQAKDAAKSVMQGIYLDEEDYSLARRESEIKSEKKRKKLEGEENA
jgi:thymidylate synthase ThyX